MRKLAPLLCAAALTLSLALPAGAYYASNEGSSGSETGSVVTLMLVMGPPGSFAPSSFEA